MIRLGATDSAVLDAHEVLATLRYDWGVQRLVCLGGPRTNAWLIEAGLVDELFLTIAPKIQGGASGTTAIEGCGFSPHALVRLELLSAYRAGSELFLRYRFPTQG